MRAPFHHFTNLNMHPLPADYQQLSDEDKIAHWTTYIYRGMRCAGEDGCEEISILDKAELAGYRATDPEIDLFMPYILGYLARMWMTPPNEFVDRVNRQMETDYETVHIPPRKNKRG